jgi:hypothetical protein
VASAGEEFRREAAANLLEDLRRTNPRLILDVEGGFKRLPYRELVDFVEENYRDEGSVWPEASRPFRVLQLKDEEEKKRDEVEREGRKRLKRQRSGV